MFTDSVSFRLLTLMFTRAFMSIFCSISFVLSTPKHTRHSQFYRINYL